MVWTRRPRPARAVRDEAPRPGTQAALLRPGVLPARDRAALVPHLADGVPARGDPAAVRLRRVRDPRPVDRRRAHARTGEPRRSRTRAGTAASRSRSGAARARPASPARSTAGATGPTARTRPSRSAGPSASTTWTRPSSTWCRCAARPGAAARGSISTTLLRRCASASSRSRRVMDAWQLESMRAEWWYACRLPVNWKIAEEAFMEQYHVLQSHPQLRIPGRMVPRPGKPFDQQSWLAGELQYLHTMSDGMAGMVHAKDVASPRNYGRHRAAGRPESRPRRLAAHAQRCGRAWHRAAGSTIPDLNDLEAQGIGDSMYYCFPHFFVLPMYSSASSYRFRPLGPGGDADGDLVADAIPGGQRAARCRRSPRSGNTTIRAGRRSLRRISPTFPASKKACTPRVRSTCGCRREPRVASRTSSG